MDPSSPDAMQSLIALKDRFDIVFACDTAPELLTRSPDGMVKVFPRRIDLENFEKLKSFEATQVAESLSELKEFIALRRSDLTVA